MGVKSGSGEAFHVVVVCHDTPPACRIRRRVSRATGLMDADAASAGPIDRLPVRLRQQTHARDQSASAGWDVALSEATTMRTSCSAG